MSTVNAVLIVVNILMAGINVWMACRNYQIAKRNEQRALGLVEEPPTPMSEAIAEIEPPDARSY